MVNDTNIERLSYSKSASPRACVESKESELYDQCFALESPIQRVPQQEPKIVFARVIKQIETMDLRLKATVTRETPTARGYVFAIHEVDSDFVTIGHGGRVALASTLRTLQLGNPRPLEVAAVLQRASFDDARALCGLITSGMTMYKTRGRAWFTMDDCCRKVVAMFSRVDKIDDSDRRDITPSKKSETSSPPMLRR
jgi:hypothetical protein